MSIKVMSRVWDDTSLQSAPRLLTLLAIADHSDIYGVCWPGMERLAIMCRKSDRQVQNDIRSLEREGKIITKLGGGRGHSNRYLITVGLTGKQIVEVLTKHPQFKYSQSQAQGVARAVLAAQKRVQSTSPFSDNGKEEKGEVQRQERVKPTSPEPSCNPHDDDPNGSSCGYAEKEKLLFDLVNKERKRRGWRKLSSFKTEELELEFKKGSAKLDITEVEKAIRYCFRNECTALPRIVACIKSWDPNKKFVKPKDKSHIHEGQPAVFAQGVGEWSEQDKIEMGMI